MGTSSLQVISFLLWMAASPTSFRDRPSRRWRCSARKARRRSCRYVVTPADAWASPQTGEGASTSVVVNVHNAPAGVQSQTSRMDAQGNVAIDVILKKAIDGAVAESLSNGSGGRLLGDDFGIKQFMGR